MNFDIIITASHIPSHPSINIIRQTIDSLKYINYNGKEKINVYLAHDFSKKKKEKQQNYIQYLKNLEEYCKNYNMISLTFNLIIIKLKNHGHLVGNIRNVLNYVTNEYLLIIQHDLPFCKNFKIDTILQDMEEYPELKHVRFNKRKTYQKGIDIDDINFWNNYNIKSKNNYISTVGWSDNNHITRKSYYNNIIMKISKNGGAMETFMAKKRPEHFGTYIFGKIGEDKYIKNLDGRNTDRKRSIIIFGKGPSVLKCTRKIIDEYEDIAICNYPVLNKFFKNLIRDREISYHFANCGTFDIRYDNRVNEKFKIKNIINSNKPSSNLYKSFLKNDKLFKDEIYEKYLKYFKKNYNFKPSTGIMALQYLIDTNKYNKILLVGFDNFVVGSQRYYFSPEEINDKLKYLIKNNTIKKDGKTNVPSEHDSIKTEKYIKNIKKKYDNIKFIKLT